jgi:hypothetical protein
VKIPESHWQIDQLDDRGLGPFQLFVCDSRYRGSTGCFRRKLFGSEMGGWARNVRAIRFDHMPLFSKRTCEVVLYFQRLIDRN